MGQKGGRKVFGLFLGMAIFAAISASAGPNDRKQAVTIANYLIAGRAVIAVNQSVINDPSMGQNRFTPGVYEAHVRKEFLRSTGIDLKDPNAFRDPVYGASLRILHESAMEVIDRFQLRINRPGKGFKGVNPAMYGVWVGKEFSRRSGIGLKQTSLRFRATYNQPDAFEEKVLKKFEASDEAIPYYAETDDEGEKQARYMVPLFITEPCLACHGEPAGVLDITGRAKEGYQLGDLRGGISVRVPIR